MARYYEYEEEKSSKDIRYSSTSDADNDNDTDIEAVVAESHHKKSRPAARRNKKSPLKNTHPTSSSNASTPSTSQPYNYSKLLSLPGLSQQKEQQSSSPPSSNKTIHEESKPNQTKAILRYLLVFIVGVWYGQVNFTPQDARSMATATTVVRTINVTNSDPTTAAASSVSERHDNNHQVTTEQSAADGWKVVHVFYGHILPAPAEETVYSQARQDEIVLALLGDSKVNPEGGRYFLDLAANHAYRLSNSFRLEQQVAPAWKGLCIEANPGYWYDLTRYRTCEMVGAVIGGNATAAASESVAFEFVNVAGHGGMSDQGTSGGIVRADFDHKTAGADTRQVYPVPIAHILTRFQVPTVIDYMSLDVEGAEYYIMEHFPFDQYEIKIMTIERPTEPLRELLKAQNYELVGDLTVWGETLWYEHHLTFLG